MTRGDELERALLSSNWTLWRWIWVRAAGFPAARVLELAAPALANVADEALAAQTAADATRADAIAELTDLQRAGGPLARGARGALEQLERGKLPRIDAALERDVACLPLLRELESKATRARAAVESAYVEAAGMAAQALREVGSDPRFREALVWQNRHALHTGVDWLLKHPGASNSTARQKQALIASYLQRYCVKNDTIGFFGPIAWGEVVPTPSFTVRPGPTLVAQRAAHLEHWAIDAVAAELARWPELKRHLAPRLLPSVRIEGTTLNYGIDRTASVPPAVARVLSACDGEASAMTLANEICADPELAGISPEEIYELLDQLVARKLLVWTLEPSAIVRPDQALRTHVGRIPDPEVRTRAIAVLDRIEASRLNVERASGDVAALDRALAELEQVFSEVTGQPATRRGGETYAARTLVYEDCVRDLSLELGGQLIGRLAPVFELIAASARWFTYQIAARYRVAIVERFRELRSAGPVPYLQFWRAIMDLFPSDKTPGPIAGPVAAQLERAWAEILQLDYSSTRIERTARGLAASVQRAFDAPAPGWPGARHVSPDVMFAARSVDELARGGGLIVLGEVHITNSLLARLLVPHGPGGSHAEIVREYERDFAAPRVRIVESKDHVTRADSGSWSPRDIDIELGSARSWRTRDHVLRAADLVVLETGDTLVVCDVPSGRQFDVIAVLETYLEFIAANNFRPTPGGEHVPRVTIDGVVLCREAWRFSRDQLPPAIAAGTRAEQFLAVRSWARARGIPRWVFLKVPEEPKPVFVDLDSPIFVEIAVKLMRNAAHLSLSEMLPSVEEAWLPDSDGQTYTAELRLVAVDPLEWSPQGSGART